jgi:AbrB family looped-hinge helix DNA binding protein
MTLPKEIRNILGIKEGDRLLLKVENDGKIIIEKAMLVPVQIEKERVNEHAQ